MSLRDFIQTTVMAFLIGGAVILLSIQSIKAEGDTVAEVHRKTFKERDKREYIGTVGNGCKITGAVSIERAESRNAGAPDAFGGAETWPNLKIEIGFQAGHEAQRDALADNIEYILREAGIIHPGSPVLLGNAQGLDFVPIKCEHCGHLYKTGAGCPNCF